MSFGANSILDMGRWALFASQVQLQVTGENIANVNTEGYSRRSVVLEEGPYIDYSPGQLGTGVKAKEVVRNFDEMVEVMYLEQASLRDKWGNLWEQLKGVENLLNESSGTGVSDSLSQYFNSWNEVSQRPDNYGARQSVINDAATLISTLSQVDTDLSQMQQRINTTVAAQVTQANTLMEEIADLNKEIQVHNIEGSNNANALFDERARKVRELGELMDVSTIDNGGGNYTILTKAGHTLVDGSSHFSLEFSAAQKNTDLRPTSTFDGEIFYDGNDDFEYTVEFVDPTNSGATVAGSVGSDSSAAQYRVSLDGGVTWLSDENGNEKHFYARDYEGRVNVEGLQIWFGDQGDAKGDPSGQFAVGDRFILSPHQGLYWVENTSTKEEITPQLHFNGEENTSRLTGGSLAALLSFRDNYVGKYREKLDNLTETLVWETNRRHSQGAGLQAFSVVEGTYGVADTTKALGSDSTGLAFGDRLQSGSTFIYVYNASTGLLVSNAALNFNGGNFNPVTNSLDDVMDAINTTFNGSIEASIVNNKLLLQAEEGYTFSFGNDSSGLMAALGLNTFFKGSSPSDLQINEKVSGDLDYLATGHVNGAGEMNTGDNTTALSMYALRDTQVAISSVVEGTTNTTMLDYYNGLVGNVGTDTNRAQFNQNFYDTLAGDLNERQQEVSGVNLDEEMSNLIRYQASYTAAAKLITTADQMLQTILSLKS
jgi:flagellar hook-associated protein 1 FlgK